MRLSNKTAHTGQAIQEYALPLALIALIAIPALVQVGNNLGDFTNETYKTVKGNPVAAKTMGHTSKLLEVTTMGDLGYFQTIYNLDNGTITFKIPESLGGGTQTTSVEGATRVLANLLKQMAERYVNDENAPLPPDLKTKISELVIRIFFHR